MPSPAHRFVAEVIRRTRRVPTVTDPDAKAAELVALNRTRRTEPPAWVAGDWEVETRDVGFPVFVLTPRSGSWGSTLVHLHGGSFTAPAHDLQWRFAARIAAAMGARLVVPAYPLAPEHTWRDSHDVLVDLVGGLAGEGPVTLQGDSAGGGMAMSVALGLRERGGPQVERMVLVSPWLDLTTSAPGTAEAGRRDPWLNVDNLPVYARFWAGSRRDLFRPEVSPGLADFTDLPPTLMICGTHDVLFPACDVVASRAPSYGWDLRFWVGEGLIHVYPLLPVPEARVARERILEFLSG